MRRIRGVLTANCLTIAAALAQQPTISPGEIKARSSAYLPRAQYTVKVDTNLVEVDVVVRDSRGRPVAGLERKDFEITDAGKKRDITAFSIQTFTPVSTPVAVTPAPTAPTTPAAPPRTPQASRYVALVFDDVSMNGPEISQAKVGARRFVTDGMAPGDLIGVFSIALGQVSPYTADTTQLLAAIDKLSMKPRSPSPGVCPTLTAYDAYLIANNLDPSALEIKGAEAMRCAGSRPRGRTGDPGSVPERFISQVRGQATATWEQVRMVSLNTFSTLRQIVDQLTRAPGKRMLLLASSGFLAGTLEREQEDLIRRAVHSGIVINALDAKGLFGDPMIVPQMGQDVQSIIREQSLGGKALQAANDVVATLADSTGGLFFHNRNDLDRGFKELGMLPEVAYLLGFTPVDPPNGKFHPIKVRLTSGNRGTVQARAGYFSATEQEVADKTTADKKAAEKEAAARDAERPIDRALSLTDTNNDVAVDISSRSGKTEAGEMMLQVIFHLDIAHLKLAQANGTRNLKLRMIAALFDQEGAFVVGKEGEMELALKDATYQLLAEQGVNATLAMPAAAGSYRLRVVAEDTADGKMKTVNDRVVVP